MYKPFPNFTINKTSVTQQQFKSVHYYNSGYFLDVNKQQENQVSKYFSLFDVNVMRCLQKKCDKIKIIDA